MESILPTLNLRMEKLIRHPRVREKARAQRVICHLEINPLKTQVIKDSMLGRRSHQRKEAMAQSKMASTWMVLMNLESKKKEAVEESQVVAAVESLVVAAAKVEMAKK